MILKNFKISIVLLLILVLSQKTNAQFEKGDVIISAGISLGYHGNVAQHYNNSNQRVIPPILFQAEKGFFKHISIGGCLEFHNRTYDYKHSDIYYKHTYFYIGAVGTYHATYWLQKYKVFNFDWSKFDIYGSVKLGPVIESYHENDWDSNMGDYKNKSQVNIHFNGGPEIGCRYYLTNNFAGFMEFGYGNIALATFGVSFKL